MLALITCAVPLVRSQSRSARPAKQKPNAPSGGQIFATSCAACHGLDGHGGERAPNIAGAGRIQGLSDADLIRIVSQGVPGTGMPAFHAMGESGTKAVVAHLRVLQGRVGPAALPGDAKSGRTIFFGQAGCSGCHMMHGDGGFLGPDLSAYGPAHAPADIRAAITDPRKNSDFRVKSASVLSRDGHKYEGAVRNEGNFSLQLQTVDGAFHFFVRSDLKDVKYSADSLMPSNYGTRLSARELDDLVSFIASTNKPAKAHKGEED